MPKNKATQRALRAKKRAEQEERLDSRNAFGISDVVPMQAVNEIMRKETYHERLDQTHEI